MKLNPSDFTRDQVEHFVESLIENMASEMSYETKKKGKMRNVLTKTLFDAPNGFKSVLGKFAEKSSRLHLIDPKFDIELPESIMLFVNEDLTVIEVCDSNWKNCKEPLFKVCQDSIKANTIPECFEPEIYTKRNLAMHYTAELDLSNVLRYISKHFSVSDLAIETGSSEYSTNKSDAIEIANTLGLNSDKYASDESLRPSVTNFEDDSLPNYIFKLDRTSNHDLVHLIHSALTDLESKDTKMILLEPFATKMKEEISELFNLSLFVHETYEIESDRLNLITRMRLPLSVKGRIVGYTHDLKTKEAWDLHNWIQK